MHHKIFNKQKTGDYPSDEEAKRIMKKYGISPEDIDRAIRGGLTEEEWERKHNVPVIE